MKTETVTIGMVIPKRKRRLGSYAALIVAREKRNARKKRLDSYAAVMGEALKAAGKASGPEVKERKKR